MSQNYRSTQNPWYKRWWAICLYAIVALFVLGGVIGGGSTQAEVEGEKVDYEELTERVDKKEDKLNNLKEEIDEIKSDITEKEDEYEKVQDLIDDEEDIQNKISDKEDKLANIKDKIENKEDKLSSIKSNIEDKKKQANSTNNNSNSNNNSDGIDINSASAAQLQQISGIGETLSNRIVNYRQTNGDFTSMSELKNVNQIGPGKVDQMRPYIHL